MRFFAWNDQDDSLMPIEASDILAALDIAEDMSPSRWLFSEESLEQFMNTATQALGGDRKAFCLYCGAEECYKPGEEKQAWSNMLAHDAECPKNPLVAKIKRLLGLLDGARNWVQDSELRAVIYEVAPPTPRTKEDG